jgi:hypothetical protein
MCDGSLAKDRADWLTSHEGMNPVAAQQNIMAEFPAQFSGAAGMQGMGMSPGWNPNAYCDGSRAEERAQWLVQNEGMSLPAAQQRIMSEFPSQFQQPGGMMHPVAPAMMAPAVVMNPMAGMVCPPVGGMGAQPCFKCQGKGWCHESSMTHDKAPDQRCFFCKDCNGCGGTGAISGGGMGMGMGGMMGGAQRCFKCQGKGFCHDSSMTHDKGPGDRCFFCKNCNSCGGTGNLGAGGMGGMGGMPMNMPGGVQYQGDLADTCKNCTIL